MIKRLMPVLLFLAIITAAPTAFAATEPFSDLDDTHENYDAIINLYENNVISGYPDQTFKANNQVNRAEFLKILIEGNGVSPDPLVYNNCFSDVTDDWYAKYVCYALEQGWIEGYPDSEFKAVNQIALVEALKMLIEIHGYADELPPTEDPDYWYVPYGELALEKGFIDDPGAPFDPLEYQTRAQIAEMTYRSMIVKEYNNEIYLGRLDAPITIYAYNDYECPFCKKIIEESFEQLKTNYIDVGDVLYIPKDFPLNFHTNAGDAALAARCANDQDAYWEMHDLLYEKQTEWSNLSDPTETFSDYASSFDLDIAQFDSCMADEIHMDAIEANKANGVEIGISAVPTLVVNDDFFMGAQPLKSLMNYLDEVLYGI
ncbi:thioredoxin domain-containing protein [Patescibacteria group bacterium]